MVSLADNLSDRPTAAEDKRKIPETVASIWRNISSTSIEPDEDPKITDLSRILLTSSKNIDINAQFNRAFRKERLFGGKAGPSEFCVISDVTTDLATDIANHKDFSPGLFQIKTET